MKLTIKTGFLIKIRNQKKSLLNFVQIVVFILDIQNLFFQNPGNKEHI